MSSKSKSKKSKAPSCAACHKNIQKDNGNALSCSNKDCSKVYHKLSCVDDKPTEDNILNWICGSCETAKIKGDDNSSTSGSNSDASEANNLRNQAARESTSEGQIQYLVSEICIMRGDISDIKNQMTKIKSSILKYNDRLDDVAETIALKIDSSATQQSDREMDGLRSEIVEARDEIDSLIYMTLRNEIEIVGIPELPVENLYSITLKIAMQLGVPLAFDDIDWVIRTGPERVTSTGPQQSPRIHRPVVIRMVRREKRNEFIKASKARRNLTAASIQLGDETQKLYINERLTKSKRMLFLQTQKKVRQLGYKYCWIKNGLIFVRKNETSPALNIRLATDLETKEKHTADGESYVDLVLM